MATSRREARAVGWAGREVGRGLATLYARVYEARVAQACARCGRAIAPGERFTRGHPGARDAADGAADAAGAGELEAGAAATGGTVSFCARCVPFEVLPAR